MEVWELVAEQGRAFDEVLDLNRIEFMDRVGLENSVGDECGAWAAELKLGLQLKLKLVLELALKFRIFLFDFGHGKYCAVYLDLWIEEVKTTNIDSKKLFDDSSSSDDSESENIPKCFANMWKKCLGGIFSDHFSNFNANKSLYFATIFLQIKNIIPSTYIKNQRMLLNFSNNVFICI